MSVTNTKAKSVYNANGTTTEWNLGFTYDDTVSNVHIYIVDANDNETEVTSNYSIAEGVLTYPTTASGLDPLAEGNKLVIVRDTPRTQDIELTSNGKLDGKVLEGGYDKLTLQVQELTEQVNRAVKIPVTEDSADNFLDPITAITEAKKEALAEIAQATEPAETAKDTAVEKAQVATEQAAIATNAATSAKAAQAGAEQAEKKVSAQAEEMEGTIASWVKGVGAIRNAVIDLGTFDGNTSVTSSRVIEFDKAPIAVSLRFSDTNKKLWINGTNSTVGIEVVDDTHCNLFYSIASADFVGQNAVKGPFVVQAVIQYPLLNYAATEDILGAVKLATKAEAEAGTNDTKAMTPLKTKYAIEANATVKTLRNDVDDLGDQVAAIESKIPAEATAANQLADKAFVTEKTDELAADVAALDADKQDKLTAGTNITISANNVISATGDDGIKGDYCTSYGILEAPNGILTNPSGMQVTLKQGVVLQLAGQDIKTTVSGDMTQTLTSTADCDLFYVSGTTSLMEVAQIVWSKNEPDNGQTGVLAWWNPDNKKWKFKSNDTGNVWAEAVATPVAHIHTDGTTITRIDHIGYRVMDDEIYALKSDVGGSGFDFEGTKAEFDAAVTAGTITDDSVSLITDDVSGDTVATKTDLAVVENKCILPDTVDYVVESYGNPYRASYWYRKYKSGWLEQGGFDTLTSGKKKITLQKQFVSSYYYINATTFKQTQEAVATIYFIAPGQIAENYITFFANSTSCNDEFMWEAKGMGAN